VGAGRAGAGAADSGSAGRLAAWRAFALSALVAWLVLQAADAEARPQQGLFGVVAQTEPSDGEFEAMKVGGVSAYRWLVAWPVLQPSPNAPPDWTGTDRLVANLARNEIMPLPFVSASPCWAVDCARKPPEQASDQPPLRSPQARRAWTRFLEELVDRYGSDGSFWRANSSLPYRPIQVWQIWNEQNSPRFYAPRPSVSEYAELVTISARAIKSADPRAQILLGGMPGDPKGAHAIPGAEFLDGLYRAGAARSFDAVAVHPYSSDIAGVERQMLAMRFVLAAHEANAPLWVTELGWGTNQGGEQGRLVTTLDGQAEKLRRAFGLMAARRHEWNLEAVLWFAWRDTPPGQPVCEWCETAGLFNAKEKTRPAWTGFTRLSGGEPVSLAERPPVGPGDAGGGHPGDARGGDGDNGGGLLVPALLAASAALACAAGAWMVLRRTRHRTIR
jgi:hypothetical protein